VKIVFLDTKTLGEDIDFSIFEKFGEVELYQMTAPNEVYSRIKDADVIILNKVIINGTNLANTSVRLVCVTATGYDNIDTQYCKENDIAVCNVQGYSTDSVAQVTVAAVLSLYTKLKEYDKFVCEGQYSESDVSLGTKPTFYEVSGKVWGIVGMGNIGKKVAQVAQVLGAKVITHSRTPKDGYENVSIDELCKRSDIITLHCPLNDESYHLINEQRLAMMKKTAVLVNVARGAVVNERAVTDAIKNGTIAAAGIDVYSKEPIEKKNPYNEIAGMDNVLLTPHMAWGAYESRMRCMSEIVKNIDAFLDGEKRNRIV